MPEQVRCPSCNAALRVPENLLGKNVKCPKCQTTFLAEMDEPAEPEGIVREPRPGPRRQPRPPEDFEEEDELPPEDELEEEYEERPRRRRRGGRRRAEAESRISGPANSLLVVGIIDIVLAVLNILLAIVGVSLLSMGGGGRGGPDEILIGTGMRVVLSIGTLIWGALITVGALRMKKLTSYGLAMTACILAMVPLVNCCCLGLPFGIWALVVLNRPEVKNAFR